MRLIGLLFLLFAAGAGAQPLDESQWVSTRATLTVGPHWRGVTEQFSSGHVATLETPTPSGASFQLSYLHFFRKWFGLSVDARGEYARVWLSGSTEGATTLQQHGLKGSVMASFRWQASPLFGLEGRLGALAGIAPFINVDANLNATASPRLILGPVLGVVATFDVTPRFSLSLLANVEARFGLASGGLFLGATARYGFLTLGDLDIGVALTLEANAIGNEDSKLALTKYQENFIRVGFGPSLLARQPAPVVGETPRVVPSVVGSVSRPDGAPLAGATVSAQGVSATTNAQGAYVLEGLAPGPTVVRAEASGLRAATKDLIITPGTPVEARFTLQAPTGPGSITGVVRASPEKPLGGAKITAGGATTTSSATGQWSVKGVGPGPVKVKVLLDGYAPADEVVQVPPEASATLDVTLEPVAQRSKAKIRGVVSSASGPVAKATVRIVELKLKQTVKADGRFEAEVPGGKYTLVIEAPRHVTQTRSVEVLDGDQAIFQIELEKAR